MHQPGVPVPFHRRWPLAQAVSLACQLEASAPKLGNVHPTRSFSDMQYAHFLLAADCLATTLTDPRHATIGRKVLAAAQAVKTTVGINTSLGTILLLAPLVHAAQIARPSSLLQWQRAVVNCLDRMDSHDAADVYAAIRLTDPGGLGDAPRDDVHGPPAADLRAAMRQVASFDGVARQYVEGFAALFNHWLPTFETQLRWSADAQTAVCLLQVAMLAADPDGLIHRKSGAEAAGQVRQAASRLWSAWHSDTVHRHDAQCIKVEKPNSVEQLLADTAYCQLDQELRRGGGRLNPGTTADLIAALLLLRLASLAH
ncbi:MAG: triphosphoribosyl-dephospho-CoA synthase [Pirellulaceae bacterium]|nr:MAG: triphosphoribosyl-dephospho-CoA synthase [Pirellulaceae bacterium]